MTADHIRALAALLPEDSAFFDADRPSWPPDREGRREAQITFALTGPDFGWLVAKSFADRGLGVPPGWNNSALPAFAGVSSLAQVLRRTHHAPGSGRP